MEWRDPLNPFNSIKCIVWRERFEALANGIIPQPVAVNVDPTNACNLNCEMCHYAEFRNDNPMSLSREDLMWIAEAISKLGAVSVCVAGGGESLCNPNTSDFIYKCLSKDIEVGVITNGILIDRNIDALLKCRWIGVSVDAATQETYRKLKGGTFGDFHKVMYNIQLLAGARRNNYPKLGFKFLLHPYNYKEIWQAANLAKDLGVDDFHIRPCYQRGSTWRESTVWKIKEEVEMAMTLESESFHVYGITHKFDGKFQRKPMQRCEVTPIAGTTFAADGWIYACCDLRGDEQGKMCKTRDITSYWGSEAHYELINNLNPMECPRRCTYVPHQEILERVFRKDSMCYRFP